MALFFVIVMSTKLDSIDIILLSNLQKKGRITNVELAENVGISAPPCFRRLKLMESRGIITGYHAEIDPRALGYEFRAVCIVSLFSQFLDEVENFVRIIKNSKNVRSCFSTLGNEEFVLTIVAKDLKEYESMLKSRIQSNKAVSGVKTYMTVNKHKDEYGIPIEE
ncbi:MAG: Lrp/AsnC family transcriptional regulator [Holosporales bacterium]|jgi:DNA-binding Lrp family transcriptional regulator|nr:Lrp/AsnC family transcriptional regulator [Holosporales bacterium]